MGSPPLFLVLYNLTEHFKVTHTPCLWACCSRCLEFLSAIFWPCKLLCILKIQLMYHSSDRTPPGFGVSLTKSVTLLCSYSSITFPCLFGSFLIISCVYMFDELWRGLGRSITHPLSLTAAINTGFTDWWPPFLPVEQSLPAWVRPAISRKLYSIISACNPVSKILI